MSQENYVIKMARGFMPQESCVIKPARGAGGTWDDARFSHLLCRDRVHRSSSSGPSGYTPGAKRGSLYQDTGIVSGQISRRCLAVSVEWPAHAGQKREVKEWAWPGKDGFLRVGEFYFSLQFAALFRSLL